MRYFLVMSKQGTAYRKIEDVRDLRNQFFHPNGTCLMSVATAKTVVEAIYDLIGTQTLKVELSEAQMFAYLWVRHTVKALSVAQGWKISSHLAEEIRPVTQVSFNASH